MMAVYVLCGIIIIQALLHTVERRDLYTRIMSRDLADYKGNSCLKARTAHERILRRWRGSAREKGGKDE